jgi:hypothetical protein
MVQHVEHLLTKRLEGGVNGWWWGQRDRSHEGEWVVACARGFKTYIFLGHDIFGFLKLDDVFLIKNFHYDEPCKLTRADW